MSESAGKMRHGAEKTAKAVGATAAGAAEGRRVQSIREPLSPGAYVEYSVDDQPGVVERARAFLAGAPGEPVAPRMAATVMLVSEGKPHYRRFESPLAGGAPIEETVDAAPVDVFMLRRASTMAFTPDAVVFPGGVGVVPWMVPGGADIARATSEQMKTFDAVVWASHGLFVSGADFDATFGLLHTIEKAADIYGRARAMNGGSGEFLNTITDEGLRQIGREFNVKINEAMLDFPAASATDN